MPTDLLNYTDAEAANQTGGNQPQLWGKAYQFAVPNDPDPLYLRTSNMTMRDSDAKARILAAHPNAQLPANFTPTHTLYKQQNGSGVMVPMGQTPSWEAASDQAAKAPSDFHLEPGIINGLVGGLAGAAAGPVGAAVGAGTGFAVGAGLVRPSKLFGQWSDNNPRAADWFDGLAQGGAAASTGLTAAKSAIAPAAESAFGTIVGYGLKFLSGLGATLGIHDTYNAYEQQKNEPPGPLKTADRIGMAGSIGESLLSVAAMGGYVQSALEQHKINANKINPLEQTVVGLRQGLTQAGVGENDGPTARRVTQTGLNHSIELLNRVKTAEGNSSVGTHQELAWGALNQEAHADYYELMGRLGMKTPGGNTLPVDLGEAPGLDPAHPENTIPFPSDDAFNFKDAQGLTKGYVVADRALAQFYQRLQERYPDETIAQTTRLPKVSAYTKESLKALTDSLANPGPQTLADLSGRLKQNNADLHDYDRLSPDQQAQQINKPLGDGRPTTVQALQVRANLQKQMNSIDPAMQHNLQELHDLQTYRNAWMSQTNIALGAKGVLDEQNAKYGSQAYRKLRYGLMTAAGLSRMAVSGGLSGGFMTSYGGSNLAIAGTTDWLSAGKAEALSSALKNAREAYNRTVPLPNSIGGGPDTGPSQDVTQYPYLNTATDVIRQLHSEAAMATVGALSAQAVKSRYIQVARRNKNGIQQP